LVPRDAVTSTAGQGMLEALKKRNQFTDFPGR
jgi:hypothetical protein